MAVAYDQVAALGVEFIGQLGNIGVHFRLQGCGEHSSRALADDVVDQGALSRGGVVIHTVSTGVPSRPALATLAYSVTAKGSIGKVRLPRTLRG